jgi:hypothetical protein
MNTRSSVENRFGLGHQENLGVSSPSSGSASVGTPSCALVEPPNFVVDGSTVQGGDTSTLVPITREATSLEICSEAITQYLIDNLLGMHLIISHPVNGLIKAFNFFMMDCSHSLQNLPFSNTSALIPFPNPPQSSFPSLANSSLRPDSPSGSPVSRSEDSYSDGFEDSTIHFQLRN